MVGFAQGAEKCVTGDLACLMAAAITHHIASFTHSTVALRHRPICSWYRRVSSYEISSTWLVPRSAAAVVLDFSPGSPFALEARTLSNTGFIIFWPPMCSMRASTSLQLFHLPATSLGHRFFAYFNPDTSPCSSHHDWKIPLAMSRKVFELVARDEKYFHCTPWFFKRVSAVFKACSDTRWPACSRQSPRKTRTSGESLAKASHIFLASNSFDPRSLVSMKRCKLESFEGRLLANGWMTMGTFKQKWSPRFFYVRFTWCQMTYYFQMFCHYPTLTCKPL